MTSIKGHVDYGNGKGPPARPPAIPDRGDTLAAVRRTSVGLRDALFDELDSLRLGTSDRERATAVGKLAAQIIAVTRLEMEYAGFVKDGVPIDLAKPLQLGRPDEA